MDPSSEIVVALGEYGFTSPELMKAMLAPDNVFKYSLWNWIAPELLTDPNYIPTRLSDFYSFGMLLIFIYGGKNPFQNSITFSSVEQVANAIIKSKMNPIIPSGIPDFIITIIYKCINVSPLSRYTSCDNIISALALGLEKAHQDQVESTSIPLQESRKKKKKV